MQNQLEQIELIKDRTNISYAEAKEALELCNNDVVEALIYLEKQNKVQVKSHGTSKGFFTAVKDAVMSVIRTGNKCKFVIKKAENTVINVPVNLLVIAAFFMLPVVIVCLALALFTGHQIRFENHDGGDINVNQALEQLSAATGSVSDKVVASITKK